MVSSEWNAHRNTAIWKDYPVAWNMYRGNLPGRNVSLLLLKSTFTNSRQFEISVWPKQYVSHVLTEALNNANACYIGQWCWETSCLIYDCECRFHGMFVNQCPFPFLAFFFLNVYSFLRDQDREQLGEEQRGRHRIWSSSRLWAVSTEPDTGLKLMDSISRSGPELKLDA